MVILNQLRFPYGTPDDYEHGYYEHHRVKLLENLRLVLDDFSRKYADLEARLAVAKLSVTSRKTQPLVRATERLLTAAKAVHSAFTTLALYLSDPPGEVVVKTLKEDEIIIPHRSVRIILDCPCKSFLIRGQRGEAALETHTCRFRPETGRSSWQAIL
jgi:hypothetical protein